MKKLNTKGFTILEMLVSLAIIAILATLFLVNYRASTRASSLSLATQQLVSDIRLAQNNTLGSTTYNDQMPLGGWGIHFDKDASVYKLFADLDGDKTFDPVEEGDLNYGARNISLPTDVIISNLTCSGAGAACPNSVDITFLPPDPITYIFNGIANAVSADIEVKDNFSGKTKNVSVNFFGLIESQN